MMKIVTVFPGSVAVKVETANRRIDRIAVKKDGDEEVIVAWRKRRQRHREASIVLSGRAAGGDQATILADEDVARHRPDRQCLAQRVALEGDANDAAIALLFEGDLGLYRRQQAFAVTVDFRDERLGGVGVEVERAQPHRVAELSDDIEIETPRREPPGR